MRDPRAKLPLLLLMALVLHTTLLGSLRVAGVAPDAMLLIAIVGGVAGGPSTGAIVGFASGLGLDLFLQTPLGLSALAFSIVGYGVGSLQSGILRSAWWIPIATAFVASMAGETLYALAGAVVGETHMVTTHLGLVAVMVGVLNAVLAPVALRLVTWALRSPYEVRYG